MSMDWNFGGPPGNMKPGQVMERMGSIGGGIVVEYTKVPGPNGEMIVQKTSEMVGGRPKEIGHATKHPDGNWYDRY